LLNEQIRASEMLDALPGWYKLKRASDVSLLRVDIAVVKKEAASKVRIYEIKPDNENGLAAARKDIDGYQAILQGARIKAGLGVSSHPGATNATAILTPFGMLTWRSPQDGIILYRFERARDEEKRKKVAEAYAPIRQKLRDSKETLERDISLRNTLATPVDPNAPKLQALGTVDPGVLAPVYATLGPFEIVTQITNVGATYSHIDPRTRQIYTSSEPIDAADVGGQKAFNEALQDSLREAAANQRAAESIKEIEEVP
jgi:hypothetical protein